MCALVTGVQTCALPIFEAGLGVAGVDVQALGFGLVPLAVDAGVRLLRLHALVIEPGMVEVDLGGAAGHVEPVFGADAPVLLVDGREARRPEEYTSELQSLMSISSAVICLKQKKNTH